MKMSSVPYTAPPVGRNMRQELLWDATKARKAKVIDAHAFDVIQRLCREPVSSESDQKVKRFAEEFAKRLDGKVQKTSRIQLGEGGFSKGADFKVQLPAAVIGQIASFLDITDTINFATTSYTLCSGVFPVDSWSKLIRKRLETLEELELPVVGLQNDVEMNQSDEDEDEDDLQPLLPVQTQPHPEGEAEDDIRRKIISVLDKDANLFPFSEEDTRTALRHRSVALSLFGRGAHLYLQTETKSLRFFIMLRYLLPRIAAGEFRLRLNCSIAVPGRGRVACGVPLELKHVQGKAGQEYLFMRFNVPFGNEAPPIIAQGSDFALYGLENDGRTISQLLRWTVSQQLSKSSMGLHDSDHRHRGAVFVTLAGERAARHLGKILHDDEHYFARELNSSASGSHGMGSYDVRRVQEVVTVQTPRVVYKAPPGYYEVNPRLGLEIDVPIELFFRRCVRI